MFRFIGTLIICLSLNILNAQKESNIWYFGEFAGIDFNTSPPTALNDGILETNEGCATRTDADGNLLFYTDGSTVYNKNHDIMLNGEGLLGHPSSTQSGVIVPKPGSSTLFYVFTVDFQAGQRTLFPSTFNYSIVDITLDNGLGALTNEKNVEINQFIAEKLVAVPHSNGTDYWLVVHAWESDKILSYLLSDNGINPIPIESTGGTYLGNSSGTDAIGYLKANREGSKLVSVHSFIGNIDVLDFDNSNGQLSNPLQINLSIDTSSGDLPYGVEFSPNGDYFYIGGLTPSTVTQYSARATNNADLLASAKIIGNTPFESGGALQLAPDGRIYQSLIGNYLSVINFPDEEGLGSGYEENAFFLDGGRAVFGLPTFQSNVSFNTEFITENVCFGDTANFRLLASNVDSVIWNFNDPNSGVNNSSKSFSPQHKFSQSGDFNVIVKTFKNGIEEELSEIVSIYVRPEIDLGKDQEICSNKKIILGDEKVPEYEYQWQDGDTNSMYNVVESGQYILKVFNTKNCFDIDTINIDVIPSPNTDLGNDTGFCAGLSVVLDAGEAFSYNWNTGQKTKTIDVNVAGTYIITQTNANACSATDTINVFEYNSPDLGPDSTYCNVDNIILSPNLLANSYTWSTGENTQNISVDMDGVYWLDATFTGNCTFRDSIKVKLAKSSPINLGADTTLCEGNTLNLTANINNAEYQWNTGEINQSIEVKKSGLYKVSVINSDACISADSIQVSFLSTQDLGNDTLICRGAELLLDAGKGFGYQWSTGETTSTITVSSAGLYKVGVMLTPFCEAFDSIEVSLDTSPELNIGTDTVICKNATLDIDAGSFWSSFLWNTGESSQIINVSEDGIYTVNVINGINCEYTDSILVNTFKVNPFNTDTSFCAGDSLILDAGNGASMYLWSTGEQTQSIVVKNSGDYSVDIINKDNCFDTRQSSVAENPKPMFTLTNNDFLCQGDTFLVEAPNFNMAQYQWSNGSTSNSTMVFSNTMLSLRITNQFSCEFIDSINVNFNPLPIIEFTDTTLFCLAEDKILNVGNQGASYSWSTGESTQSINVQDNTSYSVTVSSPKNCTNTGNTFVKFLDVPQVDLGVDTSICFGFELELNVSQAFSSYLWQDQSQTPIYKISNKGKYEVTVTNKCGTATDDKFVDVEFCDCNLLIPNAFTPNNDGLNDMFFLQHMCAISDFKIEIFNRWGDLIFKSEALDFEWDGKINGNMVKPDLYIYSINYLNNRVNRVFLTGHVSVIH